MMWAERRRAMRAGEGRETFEEAVKCKTAEVVAQGALITWEWREMKPELRERESDLCLFSDWGCGQRKRGSGEAVGRGTRSLRQGEEEGTSADRDVKAVTVTL
eukprot:1466665-Rhodomonas_salina.5